jgi:hypothetical protein
MCSACLETELGRFSVAAWDTPHAWKWPAMKNEASINLFMYWNRLRGERPAPSRTEIEPADIRRHLADTFILERDARGQSIFRLAGTRVCGTFGRELKNFAFASLFGPHDQTLVAKLINSAYEQKSPCLIGFEGRSIGGRGMSFEGLLLPLHAEGESARLFGAIIPDTKPFWLGADPIAENKVVWVRVVDPEKAYLFLNNRPQVAVPPLAPDAETLTGQGSLSHSGTQDGRKRIRHLTVIPGGLEKT